MKKEREDKDKKPEQLNLNEPPLVYQTQEYSQEAIEEELEEVVLSEEVWERIRQNSQDALRELDEQYLTKYANQTFEEAWAEALTPEEFMAEMEERIRKW